jgi:pimeloyl-ACP methyl ester carboxylesterase
MRHRRFPFLAAFAALQLCCLTPKTPLRLTGSDGKQLALADVERCAAQLDGQSIERYAGFTMATLEFSDDGHTKDEAQKTAAMQLIREQAHDGGAIIVVFVHGWHHSADAFDDNMRCFRRVIARIHHIRADDKRPIIGVYLAWRGDSIRSPWLNWATFWDRKGTSENIGKLKARDFLVDLDVLYRRELAEGRKTTLLIVGHSFGGALVYSALEYRLIGESQGHDTVLPPLSSNDSQKPMRDGVGELAILVNPAIEASRYRPFAADVAAAGDYSEEQNPRLLVIASRADWAVGSVFPLGQFFWLVFHPPYWACGGPCLIGMGHYSEQVTHELTFRGSAAITQGAGGRCGCDALGLDQAFHGKAFDVNALGSQEVAEGMTLKAIPGKARVHSPFLVVRADSSVIRGHGDIFNSRVMDFVVSYIGNLPSSTKPRLLLAPAAKAVAR